MKKVISLVLSVMMMLTMFAGCKASGTAETAAPTSSTAAETSADTTPAVQEFNIAIVQQLDHASLDEIRTAIVAQLQTLAEEKGVKVNIQEFNGQNDATVLNQIGAQVVGDGVDVIIPIATLAAQCMVTAADGTDIPIVYAAISDPEAAGLTGLDNVTGTSDALNTAFILDMMLAANPDIKTVGLLYSNSEANSATPIAEAKAYLQEKQIDFVEKTGNTYVTEHVVGIGKAEGVPQEIVDGLRANFEGECSEVGMYLAMARVAEREGYPEIAEAYKRYAYEEADHASRFAELLGEVVTDSTKKNLMMRAEAECGACAGKMDLAKKAKALNLDAIHDTVHEMAKDEARHGRGFEGLLKRYFNVEL